MSWFSRLFAKSVSPETQIVLMDTPPPKSMQREASAYIDEGFRQNAIVYSCVGKISSAVATVKPVLKRRLKNSSADEVIYNHEVLQLLQRPNKLQTYKRFVDQAFGFWSLTGNSFIVGFGPSDSKPPRELHNLSPINMKVEPGKFGIPSAYLFESTTTRRRFEVDAVTGKSAILHLKTFNPRDQWLGMSPIEAAANSVDQHNAAARWNTSLLQNSGRPTGALVLKPTSETGDAVLTENQRESLRREIDSAISGPRNAGRILLLEGGMDWKQISLSPQELDFLQGKHSSSRDVALIYGVPPQLLGIPGDNTFSNYEEARLAFWQDTIVPVTDDWFAELNNWLMPIYGDNSLYLCPDYDSIPALDVVRSKKWERIGSAKFLSLNEKREALGYGRYKPTEDLADSLFVGMGEVPLEEFGIEIPGENDEITTEEPDDDPDDSDEQTDSDVEESEEADDEGKSIIAYFEGKAVNMASPAARERYRRIVVSKRLRMEKQYRAAIVKVWRKESAKVSEVASKSTAADFERLVGQAIDSMRPEMESVMVANTRRIMKSFGADVLAAGKDFGQVVETKDSQTRFDSFVSEYVDDYVGEKIVGIYQTSRERVLGKLRKLFKESATEGSDLTPSRLIKEVQSVYHDFNAKRSFTIVRTETGNASNTSLRKAADSLGVPLKKVWIAEMSERTRDSHRAMHEAVADLDEKYIVPSPSGDVEMDGPGDPSGPPEEVINCLCVNVFRRENE